MKQVMSNEQKNQLKNEILLVQDGMMEEPIIEEEIEDASHPSPSPTKLHQKQNSLSSQQEAPQQQESSKPATSKDSPSANEGNKQSKHTTSRNQPDPTLTFAHDQMIEFSESYKNRELKHQLNSSNVQNSGLLDGPSGSNSHTFGRRSRAAQE